MVGWGLRKIDSLKGWLAYKKVVFSMKILTIYNVWFIKINKNIEIQQEIQYFLFFQEILTFWTATKKVGWMALPGLQKALNSLLKFIFSTRLSTMWARTWAKDFSCWLKSINEKTNKKQWNINIFNYLDRLVKNLYFPCKYWQVQS